MSSLIVDVYDGHYVLQSLSQGTDRIQGQLVQLLIDDFHPQSIVELNDARVRQLEGLELRSGALQGDDPDEIEVAQHGVKFIVSPRASQKTGAFLDQRENYAAAAQYARGVALDVFCYQGGFALHLAEQCGKVTGVDSSRPALEIAEKNAALNGREIEWIEANAFDLLRDYSDAGNKYDCIVLDPPPFAKSRQNLATALRGYKELNLRALKMLKPGGILVTCSCSYHVSAPDFMEIVAAAALDSHRIVRVLENRGQAKDHPSVLGISETAYLKCLILAVS